MITKKELDDIKNAIEMSLEYNKCKPIASITITFNPQTARNLYNFLNSIEELVYKKIVNRETANYIPPNDLFNMIKTDIVYSIAEKLLEDGYIQFETTNVPDPFVDNVVRGSLFVLKQEEDLHNMTWEEFENESRINTAYLIEPMRKPTDIYCPKCGKKIYVRTDIVLTTYPPKSQYECDCGWVGYH